MGDDLFDEISSIMEEEERLEERKKEVKKKLQEQADKLPKSKKSSSRKKKGQKGSILIAGVNWIGHLTVAIVIIILVLVVLSFGKWLLEIMMNNPNTLQEEDIYQMFSNLKLIPNPYHI